MRRSLNITIEILIFLALAALTAILLFPVQREALSVIASVRDNFIALAEKDLSIKINYSGMSPSILGTFDIRGISINTAGGAAAAGSDTDTDADADGNKLLTVERLRIKYSLAEIIAGRMHSTVTSLSINKPVLYLNANANINIKDAENEKFDKKIIDDLFDVAKDFIKDLDPDFNIRVNRAQLKVIDAKNIEAPELISVNSLNLNSYLKEGRLFFKADGKIAATIKNANKAINKDITITVPLKIDGNFDFERTRGDFNILLPETRSDLFTLRRTRFISVYTKDFIAARKIDDRYSYDLSARADLGSSNFYVRMDVDNFSFSNILTLKSDLAPYNEWLYTRLRGHAILENTNSEAETEKTNGLTYTINLGGSFPENTPLGRGLIEINAAGNEKIIRVNKLNVDLARGKIGYAGSIALSPFSPKGTLNINEFYFGKDGENGTSSPVTAEFTLTGIGNRSSIFADELRFGETVLNAFDIEMLYNKSSGSGSEKSSGSGGGSYDISVSALRFNNIESYEDVSVSRITGEAKFDLSKNNFSSRARIDSLALGDILNMAGVAVELPSVSVLKNMSVDTFLTAEFTINSDSNGLQYNAPNIVLASYGLFQDTITVASLSGTNKTFELTKWHTDTGISSNTIADALTSDGIDITASANYADPNNMRFNIKALLNNLSYEFNGTFTDKKVISVTGNYNFAVRASIGAKGSLRGDMSVDSLVLPTTSKDATLSMDTNFNITSLNDWNINLKKIDINNLLRSSTASSLIHISGEANEQRIYIPEILFDDGIDPLRGVIFCSLQNGGDETQDELHIDLRNGDGTEKLSADGRFLSDALDLKVQAVDFRLYRFLQHSQSMIVNGVADFTFEPGGAFNVIFNLESLKGRANDNEFMVSFQGSLNNDRAEIGKTNISYANFTADLPYISIDRKNATIESTAFIFGSTQSREMHSDLNIKCNFSKINSWGEVSHAFREVQGSVNFTNVFFFDDELGPQFDVNFSKRGRIITISGGPQDMLEASFDTRGTFYVSLSSPFPLSGTIFGEIKNREINADTTSLYADLARLWNYFPDELLDVVYSTGGFALGELHISGNVIDPDFYGIVRGYGVKLVVPQYLKGEVGPVPVTLRLSGKEMKMDPLTAPVGEGMGHVSAEFYFEGWNITNTKLNFDVNKDTPLPYAVDIAGISATGNISGTLSVEVENKDSIVTGNIIGSDSIITLDMLTPEELQAELDKLAGDPDVISQIDITIQSGNKVEFLFPEEKFPILRATVEVGDEIHITGDSLSGKSSIVGNLGIRGGTVFYFQRSFYIREGELNFDENEVSFDPKISARAEIRDQTNDGPVTISMILDNQSLTSFIPVLQSTPALSQVEILSLLGNTFIDTTEEETSTGETRNNNPALRSVIASGADILQIQFLSIAENKIRNWMHLDMFSARTQILQNYIIDMAMISSEERDTNIFNYLNNTTLFMGKYITPDLFMESMLSASYNKNKIENNGINFDLFIGMELKSPLFNIRAEINPDMLNPEKLWVPDTSVTLSRSWRLP